MRETSDKILTSQEVEQEERRFCRLAYIYTVASTGIVESSCAHLSTGSFFCLATILIS